MKLILILVILILTCYTSQTLSQNTVSWNGIGIWNTRERISVGVVGWSGNPKGVEKVGIPNAFYDDKGFQQSTFNNVTKVLTLIAQKFENGGSTIYSIDCTQWKVISTTPYSNQYSIGGLASDQTVNNNVYAIYTTSSVANTIYRIILNPSNNNNILSLGNSNGQYCGSVYTTSNQMYYLAFTNTTGLYLLGFNNAFNPIDERKISFANNLFPVQVLPLNLVYDSYSDSIIANVQMAYSDDSATYGLGYLDLTTDNIVISNMYGYSSEYFSTTVIDSNYGYTFAFDDGGYYALYQWNLFTGTFASYKDYNTPVLAAF